MSSKVFRHTEFPQEVAVFRHRGSRLDLVWRFLRHLKSWNLRIQRVREIHNRCKTQRLSAAVSAMRKQKHRHREDAAYKKCAKFHKDWVFSL